MLITRSILVLLAVVWAFSVSAEKQGAVVQEPDVPLMYYADSSHGASFAKDPDVVRFLGRYYMYFTIKIPGKGYAVGIATSDDLVNWSKAGEMLPGAPYEAKGLAAPAAMVRGDRVHLFYQTYGNKEKDAICHAYSTDGINFVRNESNPIFSPTGEWNCGRAIDAEVVEFRGRFFLYCATRDPGMKIQMLVVATAPADTDFGRDSWTQRCSAPILKPELPWEQTCIEAAAVCEKDGRLYMFYAGAYNNKPQQIGCAVSEDGLAWKRLSGEPLLPNGRSGEWNSSESGHPGVFVDGDGQMHLFFQGNDDNGKTWWLSRMKIGWEEGGPYLVRPRDGREFHLKRR